VLNGRWDSRCGRRGYGRERNLRVFVELRKLLVKLAISMQAKMELGRRDAIAFFVCDGLCRRDVLLWSRQQTLSSSVEIKDEVRGEICF
jgi:hypothetical protein